MPKERLHRQQKQAILLLLPLLFWLLPTAWLERGPSLCLITRVTGKACPGCGTLRALSALAHGNIRRAWGYNRLVFIVAPLLGFIWGKALFESGKPSPYR
jgi:uncharacterized protein DUF2752